MTKTLESILETLFSHNAHWKIAIIKNWSSIAGKLHEHVSVEKITDNSIILVVNNSCLLQELFHLSDLFIQKINQTLDQPRIKNVRFKLKSEKKKSPDKTILQTQKKMIELKLQQSDIVSLENIKDPELRTALKNFRLRCYRE